MKRITAAQHQALVADGEILQQERYGIKVWLLPDRRVVKVFRVKRPFSSARIYPYNLRFSRNARRLLGRGVSAPHVLDTWYCPEIQRHGVVYELLEGVPFVELLADARDENPFYRYAGFLGQLHEKGIYFRSAHPGNVLLKDDGSMGLIDIQDMRFWNWPLGRMARARNFRHIFNSKDNSLAMRDFGFENFVDLYLRQLPRSEAYVRKLKPLIMKWDKAWEPGSR
ncbi:hypothetical protein [Thiolapillus sp.]